MSDNVTPLPGVRKPTSTPNQVLIKAIEEMLEYARSGSLQSLIATGFDAEGKSRYATWVDRHNDVYQMLGALAWLQHEYVDKHTDGH